MADYHGDFNNGQNSADKFGFVLSMGLITIFAIVLEVVDSTLDF